MKLWNLIMRAEREARNYADFEELCLRMMEDPAIGRGVRPDLDNEFYGCFGMSAEEVSLQLSSRKSRV